jgi:hypothetical protein
VIWQGLHRGDRQHRLDPLVCKLPKSRDNDFSLDQLKLLVLADDTGVDHPRDLFYGERPPHEAFSGDGGAYADHVVASRFGGARHRPPMSFDAAS